MSGSAPRLSSAEVQRRREAAGRRRNTEAPMVLMYLVAFPVAVVLLMVLGRWRRTWRLAREE